MPRKGGFNWKGIEETEDGSYITSGKNEKRRLLKSLHSSGYAVRSRKNPDRSWTVTTVGTMRPTRSTRRRPVRAGHHPRTRAFRTQGEYTGSRPQGRYIPIGRTRRYSGIPRPLYPRPRYGVYGTSTYYQRPTGPSYLQQYQKHLKERQETKLKEKKTEQETTEKMRAARIQNEREETARQVRRNELHAESIQHERHERADRLRSQAGQPVGTWQGGQVATVPPKKEQKVDSVALQKERENEVT